MKKKYIRALSALALLLVFTTLSFSQNRESLWTKTSKERFVNAKLVERKAIPQQAQFYELNLELLKQELTNAPNREVSNELSNLILDFPDSDGKLESFRIKEASILAPELQRQVPNIRSYVGVSVENPSTVIRFSVTPQGLHTMTLSSEKGTQYIDPYVKNTNVYAVYSRKDLPIENKSFECQFEEEGLQIDIPNVSESEFRNANDGKMRNFRLALACTVEYAEFHWTAAGLTIATPIAERKNAVLAAMVVTMTRVNALYERELSLNMTIIPNNLDIIYITTDPYTNDNGGMMLGQNQTNLDNVIGSANYDIGHVFSTGGGGVATLNSPCLTGSKARGVTGLPAPVGDIFDYEYVAHEMGHQYGSPHTWNSDVNNGSCPLSQRSSADAYEPGSGSTIMGYAGLCGDQNVQTFTDIYFHQRSIQRIWFNLISGNSQCGDQTDTGNSAPTADAGADYVIPRLTPYKLTGSATDSDGTGSLTYTWEQFDLGSAGVPTESTSSGPLVRSFEGTSNPVRYVPNLPDLMDSNGSTDWEKLPGTSRSMNFQLTVRDNDARGGQSDSDAMLIDVAAAAGPFMVTSQAVANSIVWTPGETETITWNVAGTTGLGVNTANVNILLSTDEGQTFDTVLASNVPNDGSHDISVPNVTAPYCRVMVEAVGNIFFSVNEQFFAVGDYTYGPIDQCTDYTFNAGITIPESDTQYSGWLLTINDSFTITDLNVNVDITHNDNADLYYGIRAPFQADGVERLASGICPGSADVNLTFDDEGNAVDCGNTTSGADTLPLDPLSFADGQNSDGQWIFFATDINVGDGNQATWNTITLTLCQSGTGPILSVDEISLEDTFFVYPNPNNGQFTIKLKSNSGKDINVEVFDIRGRSILNQSYRNTGDFNQTISLDNAQSGMYLLNINDGDKKVTKKIIVN
ncbi:zinc-dependent metalloprotease [Hanstruepera marina]|uniref:zinc-dependent metalloprotease n=1 Tax=Hanstruepera marina TaxID=2873265 RepID=UPI001CA6195F|nr:zinc-dependent metalloprotease family protein [Hanstruepera marina]